MTDVREVIIRTIMDIQEQKSHRCVELEDNLNITKDLGLSSLDIAQLIASLEIELDADPFSDGVPISSISTIGELCEVYRTYLEQ